MNTEGNVAPTTGAAEGQTVATQVDTQAPTTSQTPGQSPEAAGEQAAQAKKPNSYQRKIAELAYQNRELQRERERLLNHVLENQRPSREDKAPDPNDPKYRTVDEYIRDLTSYQIRQAMGNQQPSQVQQVRDDSGVSQAVEQLRMEGSEKYDDFNEVLDSGKFITEVMRDTILESDTPVDLAYHLCKNVKEARRIASLSPARQAAEIGKLEDKLTAAPPAKKPSAAPAPIEPVQANGGNNDNSIKPSMGFEEFMKIRNKQLRRK